MEQSLRIIEQAIEQIPPGDIAAKIPKVVRTPKGEMYTRTETPRGELGFYLVSDATTHPSRVKVRSPAFCNLSLTPHISKGYMVADMVAIIGSIDIVLGEVDR
jgi:NADH-quinone oxidoreductase subunit D